MKLADLAHQVYPYSNVIALAAAGTWNIWAGTQSRYASPDTPDGMYGSRQHYHVLAGSAFAAAGGVALQSMLRAPRTTQPSQPARHNPWLASCLIVYGGAALVGAGYGGGAACEDPVLTASGYMYIATGGVQLLVRCMRH